MGTLRGRRRYWLCGKDADGKRREKKKKITNHCRSTEVFTPDGKSTKALIKLNEK